jgi:predicted adenylyl cyclase CyaB
MYEVEVKAKLKNRKAVIKKLKAFGCKFSEELRQIDYVFIPQEAPYPLFPLGTPALRLRKQNDVYFLTLKIPQSSYQDCIEREIDIQDGKRMLEILKLIGWKSIPTVEKRRIKTKFKGVEIVLDKVEHLGEFMEAEKIVKHKNHETRKKVQEELFDFLGTLGVSKKDHVINGKYDIMLWHKLNDK